MAANERMRLHWKRLVPAIWSVDDGHGHSRQVARTRPRGGHVDDEWTVTGPRYSATRHATWSEAKAVAEESLGSL